MHTTLTLQSIETFLATCKKEILKGNCYFVGRTLNLNGKIISAKQALLDLGIMNKKELWNHILELKSYECVKVDFDYDTKRDTNSEIYVFKKIINKKEVYIKLTMRAKGIICISFHESIEKKRVKK